MLKKEKELFISEFTEKIKNTSAIVLTEYQGLTVSELCELRSKLRPLKCEYTIVKNTLGRIVLTNLGFESFSKYLTGPTAIAIEKQNDPVSVAKILVDFSKEHNKLRLKAGLLEGKVISANEVQSLATLPPKEVLISRLLGTMKVPLYNLVSVLQGTTRSLIYVLEAIKKQKSQLGGNQGMEV